MFKAISICQANTVNGRTEKFPYISLGFNCYQLLPKSQVLTRRDQSPVLKKLLGDLRDKIFPRICLQLEEDKKQKQVHNIKIANICAELGSAAYDFNDGDTLLAMLDKHNDVPKNSNSSDKLYHCSSTDGAERAFLAIENDDLENYKENHGFTEFASDEENNSALSLSIIHDAATIFSFFLKRHGALKIFTRLIEESPSIHKYIYKKTYTTKTFYTYRYAISALKF